MTGLAIMGARKTAFHMTLLVCILSLSVCVKGHEDTALQSRIERFLQEAFQPGQAFGGSSGSSSPPPGPPQSLTPIPRDSSLAKAVLTGQGPGRKLMSFAAMRPLYTSAFGVSGEEEQGVAVRQRPYSRGLLQRLSNRASAELGAGADVEQESGAHLRSLHMLR